MARKKLKIKPEQLSDGKWQEIEEEWKLDPKHQMLCTLGRQAWTRWTQLKDLLDAQGVMIKGRYGSRLNPLISAEARARESLIKVLAAFDFDGSSAHG